MKKNKTKDEDKVVDLFEDVIFPIQVVAVEQPVRKDVVIKGREYTAIDSFQSYLIILDERDRKFYYYKKYFKIKEEV